MLTEKAIKFLESRKIDIETATNLGLSSVERHGTEWLAYPYYDGDVVVNHKYRRLDKKEFEQDKGGKACFWNKKVIEDQSLKEQPLIVVEGESDCLAAIQSGFLRAVSVPNGAPAEEIGEQDTSKYVYLDNQITHEVKEIILAVDNDPPGTNLLHDLALRLGSERCKWIKYPKRRSSEERCKDLNEVLMVYGGEGVSETLKRAQWIKSDGVYQMADLPPLPVPEVHEIGMAGIDNHYRIRKGDFCVITGIPSHGKTSFINDISCRMVDKHGWKVAFASFEQCAQTDHRFSLRTWKLGKYPKYASLPDIQAADEWINKNFRFIIPADDDSPNIDWVLSRCAMAVTQHGCDMIVIDPWNEMDHCRNQESLTEYVGNAIKSFKRLARKLNVHLVVTAHPAKMRRENGTYPPPSLYDISDSAHWANKADVGIVVNRPDKSVNMTEIHVAKVRYQNSIGTPGIVKMHFLPDRGKYEWMQT